MGRTLDVIAARPGLTLQVVATGMHLDRSRGYTVREVRQSRWGIAATVPWPVSSSAGETAAATGRAIAGLARVYDQLGCDVVLVVGDRVEAFAAATAAHIGGRCVAHVHGGDRALGVVDDSLRHAISKLAHVHFPATRESAKRLIRMGEDRRRVHRVGSPGLDGIQADAAHPDAVAQVLGVKPPYLLASLHPAGGDAEDEAGRARLFLQSISLTGVPAVVLVYPNNDPGSSGIVSYYEQALASLSVPIAAFANLPRSVWLGALRDAALLVGNSSSGIIEAASFGTPVVDIGPRQKGREHGANVVHVDYDTRSIAAVIRRIWSDGNPRRLKRQNLYGDGRAGQKIAQHLSQLTIDKKLLQKLIAY